MLPPERVFKGIIWQFSADSDVRRHKAAVALATGGVLEIYLFKFTNVFVQI